MRINRPVFLFVTALVVTTIAGAQAGKTPAGQTLNATSLSAPAEALLNGAASWDQVPAHRISLNRTPPLYDTDEPASLEIPVLDVRVARAGRKCWCRCRGPIQPKTPLPCLKSRTPLRRRAFARSPPKPMTDSLTLRPSCSRQSRVPWRLRCRWVMPRILYRFTTGTPRAGPC